jgi:hypothetical protein
MSRDGDGEHARHGHAGDQQPQPVPGAIGQRRPAREAHECAIGLPEPRKLPGLATVDGKLGGAADGLNELSRQFAAGRCFEPSGPATERAGCGGDCNSADEQAGGEDYRRGGKKRGRDGDRDRAGDEGDERRADAAQVEVLERVDVGDHPREEVSAAVALELDRRKRLDALVHVHACPRQHSQSEVVRGKPLEVPDERP